MLPAMWILYLIIVYVFQWQFVSALVTSMPGIEGPNYVLEGKSIALACTNAVCTNGTCQFSWSGFAVSSVNKNILDLQIVNRSYANETYTCTVKDIDNVPKTAIKSFDVYYGPDSVTVEAGSTVTVIEDEKYDDKNFLCKAPDCHPACKTFRWSKSGTVVSSSAKLFSSNKEIKRTDAGTYVCTASNGHTDNKTAQVALTVHYAPHVELIWDKDSKVLGCTADGIPRNYSFDPIQQYVGSIRVRNNVTKKTTGSTATVTVTLGEKDYPYQDTGRYKCYVSNGIKNIATNTVTQKAVKEIEIEDLPQLVESAKSYNVSKGDRLPVEIKLYSKPKVTEVSIPNDNTAFKCGQQDGNMTLTCEPQNVPTKFHGVNVTTSGQKLTLTFHKAMEENFKSYTIYMSNTVGDVSTNITIFPEGPPDTPTNFYKADSSHESVTFTLVTGFFNGGGQTVVVQHKLTGNQSSWSNSSLKYAGVEKNKQVTLTAEGLSAETLYEFRAYAYNKNSSSAYTDIIKEKTKEAPVPAGVIAGSVVGSVAVLIIVVVVVVLVIRYRRQKKETDEGTFTNQNKDLTLEIPTTPGGYQNHQVRNEYVKEPVTPDSPSKTIIYENTLVGAGNGSYEDRTNHTANYDVPRSHARHSPYQSRDNNVAPYDVPRSHSPYPSRGNNLAPYDVPRSQTTDDPARVGLYDLPRSQGAVGSNRNVNQTDGTVPPYLELSNPDAVEEAYLNVNESKQLMEQRGSKSRLNKQDTVTADYLDMNEVNALAPESVKPSNVNESPYYNTQTSETYENTHVSSKKKGKTDKEGKEYQNVAKYKKEKAQKAGDKTPNMEGAMVNEEETKDYQNVNRYKKGPKQQPSVDSQSELYMPMETGSKRKSVMSIPDYQAPPPPMNSAPEEENYMNIRVGNPQR